MSGSGFAVRDRHVSVQQGVHELGEGSHTRDRATPRELAPYLRTLIVIRISSWSVQTIL